MNYVTFNAFDRGKSVNFKSPFLEILDAVTLLNCLNRLTHRVLRVYKLGLQTTGVWGRKGERFTLNHMQQEFYRRYNFEVSIRKSL